jgi:hypothetical protein
MPKAQAEALAHALSGDQTRADAIATISKAFKNNPESVATYLPGLWLEPLTDAGENDVIADWCLATSLCTPAKPLDLASMEKVLEARAKALLAEHKTEQALAAAKSYFNFVRLRNSASAEDLIFQCLAANPQKKALAQTFLAEQQRGRTPSTQPVISTVMQSIKVPSKPYDDAIAKIEERANGASGFDYYHSLLQRGNRLLLADKPAEARNFFEDAYEFSSRGYGRWFSAGQVKACAESVARAIRAQDGTPARALDYLSKVPEPGSDPTTRATTNP